MTSDSSSLAAMRSRRTSCLGYPSYRVGILTSVDGVEFDDAGPRRLSIDVDGLALEVIGRDDLIRNKVAADRPQDRADVARLTQPESAD